MPLNAHSTIVLGELVEHMFDRLNYLRMQVEKVQGAAEALEMWWLENGDPATLYRLPVRPPATQEGVGAERDLGLDHDGSAHPS